MQRHASFRPKAGGILERSRHLLVKTPGGRATDRLIRSAKTMIGRGEECDLVIDSPFVSKVHAALEVRGESAYVLDMKSRNGVVVNGRKVSKGGERQLRQGDEIGIGDCVLTYSEHGDGDESTQLFLDGGTSAGGSDAIFVDAQTWEVWIEGKPLPVRLSKQEMELLKTLFERAGSVCAREELCNAVWGEGNYDTWNMLNRLVLRLREKVEPDSKNPTLIVTIPGVGYMLRIHERRPDSPL